MYARSTNATYDKDTAFTEFNRYFINGPRREKTYLQGFANNKGTDQPVHLCSLISAFVIHLMETMISNLATSEISLL